MKKLRLKILIIICQFWAVMAYAQTENLRNQLESFIKTKKADIGVAILGIESGDTLTIGNEKHYPMQSVYKFHLALAVLNQVDKGKLSLSQKIFITHLDLLPNTWSPLREKYPEANVEIPLSEILSYTISQSDNNGCDILFRLVGGTKKVHKYIHKLGMKNVAIKGTEAEMHKDWQVQFTNWATPLSVVQLLHTFYSKNILSKTSFDFLWKAMVETKTGPKRIKGLLPEGTIVAHKTGYSGANKEGLTSAINDVGIVQLPNGQHFAIAVFVSNTKENLDTTEGIIAEITNKTWNYFIKK